jgi:hypothetical protein
MALIALHPAERADAADGAASATKATSTVNSARAQEPARPKTDFRTPNISDFPRTRCKRDGLIFTGEK